MRVNLYSGKVTAGARDGTLVTNDAPLFAGRTDIASVAPHDWLKFAIRCDTGYKTGTELYFGLGIYTSSKSMVEDGVVQLGGLAIGSICEWCSPPVRINLCEMGIYYNIEQRSHTIQQYDINNNAVLKQWPPTRGIDHSGHEWVATLGGWVRCLYMQNENNYNRQVFTIPAGLTDVNTILTIRPGRDYTMTGIARILMYCESVVKA